MPERIDTAQIESIDCDSLEKDDRFPGAYGFRVLLDRDPGVEWGVEFDATYEGARYAGKPPVFFNGNHLKVFYLGRYASDLQHYLTFLLSIVNETNQSVQVRNSVLPNEEREREEFRLRLRDAARTAPFGPGRTNR